jgi:hypothetical protein
VLDSLVQTLGKHYGAPKLYAYAQLAAVLGDRERAFALLARWRHPYSPHYDVFASDFESLKGYAPYEKMISPH